MIILTVLMAIVLMPDLTPGITDPVVTQATIKKTICIPEYAAKARNVPLLLKMEVFRRYGIPYDPEKYETDHLIPLELGGANDLRNLWPQPWPEAHEKDKIENCLHHAVCSGKISLKQAQECIRKNWRMAGRLCLKQQ